MKEIPTASIHAIITDPPYLVTDLPFDKQGFDIEAFLSEAARVLKPNGYLVSMGTIELLARFTSHFKIRFSGCWVKANPSKRTASAKKPATQAELFALFTLPKAPTKALTWNRLKFPSHYYKRVYHKRETNRRGGKDQLERIGADFFTKEGFIQESSERLYTNSIFAPNKATMRFPERTDHPTQKPEKLYEVFIGWTTNEDDIVLDPFAGSCTLAIVARYLNRKFICIEREEEYLRQGLKRFDGVKRLNPLRNKGKKRIGKGKITTQMTFF